MSENLNSLSEPNKTLEESPNSNFSSQVSSPAAAANWIKNAIQSPHSQNKTPHDLFTDFESLKSPPSDPNLTSKSATTYSRLQTLSGSSPLRTKILHSMYQFYNDFFLNVIISNSLFFGNIFIALFFFFFLPVSFFSLSLRSFRPIK
ncbi:hypothetical protein HMI54_000798 [Coelomomyces lativittatus]|nr:hypothetical protein HMI54_000798 [Coelomomyces lativittatus]